MEFIEGQFIATKEGLIFEVKGNIHPKNRVFAYLRYIPVSSGRRVSNANRHYNKVYDLSKREQYLQFKYPQYLWYDPVTGRVQQCVLINQISQVFDPVTFLNKLRNKTDELNELQNVSIELTSNIVESCNISWQNIGITGSQLVGLETEKSDIDIVIYGKKTGEKVHSKLAQIGTIFGVKRYSGSRLEKHVTFRWNNAVGEWRNSLITIERKKIFQGIFKNYEFFIRAVKRPSEMGYKYGDLLFRELGRSFIRCTIVDDSDSIFTPCQYDVVSKSEPELKSLLSFRGRFTEQIQKGMRAIVSGRLERVIDLRTMENYLQIVMGEKSEDILVPL